MLEELPARAHVPTVSGEQMAEVDRAAVALGISIEMLMENAARGIALAARLMLGGLGGRRIACLAGRGNNGGDAIAAARRLAGWGARPRCVLSDPPERLHGELNQRQLAIAQRLGIEVARADAARLDEADLIVDGLLGYSVRGAPRGDVELLIRAADRSPAPILAIDLPSGLDPDSGEPLGIAIRAAVTVTLAMPKRGLIGGPSRNLVGELLLADIAIPAEVYDRFGIDARGLFTEGELLRVLS